MISTGITVSFLSAVCADHLNIAMIGSDGKRRTRLRRVRRAGYNSGLHH